MSARVTNEEFGQKVGCDFTMASRLRNGRRLPSRALLGRIVEAYGLDATEALAATSAGREAFAAYLDRTVFNPEMPEEDQDPEEGGEPDGDEEEEPTPIEHQ